MSLKLPRKTGRSWSLFLYGAIALLFAPAFRCQAENALQGGEDLIVYTNHVDAKAPLSIHIVRMPLKMRRFELCSVHATGKALGLRSLSEQMASLNLSGARAVAAINGDFYQREGSHAGDPRGLQIVDAEMISAPDGTISFWLDPLDQPQAGATASRLTVSWPDGSSTAIGLNGNREPDGLELFTPSAGASSRTEKGRDFILEYAGTGPWLPIRPGRSYQARVRDVHDRAGSEIPSGGMVLSAGPLVARSLPPVEKGAVLTISTATSPSLRGVETAISGGPLLVREGKVETFARSTDGPYEFTSVWERHPRSAVGWNEQFIFLVQVDGRQRKLSRGMALPELAAFLMKLGCTGAINLDGGGSSTFWYDGRVRNSPGDGEEREIANALVIVERTNAPRGLMPKPLK